METCCFNTSEFTGTPDTSPCPAAVDIPACMREADRLKGAGDETGAVKYIEEMLGTSRTAGDWKSELSLCSELSGMYRHTGEKEKALMVCGAINGLVNEHGLGETVTGATCLLNAATTLNCFGLSHESLTLFTHVSRVYGNHLDPSDYRFAALYNNMALTYEDSGEPENAISCYTLALRTLEACGGNGNEKAVTCCNMAEMYYKTDPLSEEIYPLMEKAWEYLNGGDTGMDGYHAYTVSKCLPVFEKMGYFVYCEKLRKRVEEIRGTA